MQTYILRRVLLFFPTLLLITVMVFGLMRLVPGDPALLRRRGDSGEDRFTEQELDELRAHLGTDRPWYVQYGSWVGGMLQLDFGVSLYTDDPIAADIATKIPITAELVVLAMLLAVLVAAIQVAPTTPLMSWMAAVPTPLDDESTSAVSFACNCPSRTTMPHVGR